MCPLPKWQKCLIGHSLRNSAHSSVHARRWHFCHLCPRPARIFVHSVMNGRGYLIPVSKRALRAPTPELVMHPCSHRPTSVGVLSVAKQGSGIRLRFNARVRGGRSVRSSFVPQALPLVLSCRFAALCAVRPQMGFLARLARGGGLYRHVPRARPLAPLRSRRAP